jgi:Cu+-exporting ATPase
VSATVNGHTVIVGKPTDPTSSHDVEVTIDDVPSGTFDIGESLSDSARGAIAAIRKLDIEPVICSGDSVRRVDAIANSLGVERRAGAATPGDKIALIRQLQSQHRSVLMAGDGLNDAAALAAADLSIAMGSGTDVARESSDVVLLRDDLSAIANAIVIARATHRTIRINLFWASIYNLAALPIAMTGRLSPMIASGAMAASSVLVVGNSARLRYTKLRPGPVSLPAASRAI